MRPSQSTCQRQDFLNETRFRSQLQSRVHISDNRNEPKRTSVSTLIHDLPHPRIHQGSKALPQHPNPRSLGSSAPLSASA